MFCFDARPGHPDHLVASPHELWDDLFAENAGRAGHQSQPP